MEPFRPDLDYDFEKSDEQRERLHASNAVQHAADTMVAVTESFRHHYHQQYGGGYEPRRPEPTYTHSRSSSSSSMSSQRLLAEDPMGDSVSPMSISRSLSPQLYSGLVPAVLVPGLLPRTESPSLLHSERPEYAPARDIPGHLLASLRLSTPELPPRLDTPHTPHTPPTDFYHAVAVTSQDDQPAGSTTNRDRSASDTQDHHNGFMQTAKRIGSFKPTGFQYSALQPDHGTKTKPLGTVTHIRSGSDSEPLMSNEVRRKPLAPGARTIEFNHSFTNELLFVAVICLAQLLTMAGFAQGLIPARAIGKSFSETTPGHLAWYSGAYTLTAGAFNLPGTRLGGIFGHKRIFILGYVWFALWSLLAGLGTYVENHIGHGTAYFCFCRGMQGIGPAMLVPNGQAMLRRAYPPGQRKGFALGIFDAAAPVGFVLGAVMASLLAGFASWSWAFYSSTTVCLALAALSALIIPGKDVMMHNLDGSLWARLDTPALLCGLIGLVLFDVGWNQVPIASFNAAYTYVLIIIGAFVMVPFVYLENKARHPLVPFKRMQASAGVILGCTAACWASFAVWLWYLVQLLEALRGWNALRLSAGFVPLLISGLVVGFFSSHLLTKKFGAHWVLLSATLAVFVSSVLMATTPEKQTYWLNTFFSILIMPFGMVLSTPAAVTLLGRSLPEGHHGLAPGLTTTAVGYSMSIGLGMAGAVEKHVRDAAGDTLRGYHGAQYLGLGFSGLSVILALGFVTAGYLRR
ncbi:hypothetical protein G7046_g2140 [Stylonectria norvegica]|nr:hypothetical protein G7046_g2140 [Stylonectria norvegica]